MLEPNKDLETIFEKAVSLAAKNKHEYITLEHFLYSLVSDKKFAEVLDNYGAKTQELKTNLEKFISEELTEIVDPKLTEKPKKTHGIDRVLNRAFTQVLFSGRSVIEPVDCFISLFSEKKSHAIYFMKLANIDKEKFIDFIQRESGPIDETEVTEVNNRQLEKLIVQFCINLSARAKSKKIDPVIGREKEIEELT